MQLEPEQIESLRPWVEAETGMDFSGDRKSRLEDAVHRVLPRLEPLTRLDRLLEQPQERALFLERLTAELTVGESFFFRNEYHFRALRDHVLPAILCDNEQKREVRVWSAGCAGGEEPYSLAILLDQEVGHHCNWQVSILGTDLNPDFLARARAASYRPWSFRHTEIHRDRTYFQPEGDLLRVAPHIREMTRFMYLNLVKDVYPSPLTGTLGLDLILFRNVAIYLKPAITRRIIERFYRALRPGGWLLLGETEVSLAPTEGFEARRFEHATFHQKLPGAAVTPSGLVPPPPVLADSLNEPLPTESAVPLACGQWFESTEFPALPDWVPLPTKPPAGSPVSASRVPQLECLLAERRFDELEQMIETITARTERAELRLRLARELLASAEIARARILLRHCLSDEPLMIEAQLLDASFSEECGDLDSAEQSYRRALYIDRNCPMAHFHLALVQQQRGNASGAAQSVKTTLKLIADKPPHDLVQYGEGVCYGRLREMARTVLEF